MQLWDALKNICIILVVKISCEEYLKEYPLYIPYKIFVAVRNCQKITDTICSGKNMEML